MLNIWWNGFLDHYFKEFQQHAHQFFYWISRKFAFLKAHFACSLPIRFFLFLIVSRFFDLSWKSDFSYQYCEIWFGIHICLWYLTSHFFIQYFGTKSSNQLFVHDLQPSFLFFSFQICIQERSSLWIYLLLNFDDLWNTKWLSLDQA